MKTLIYFLLAITLCSSCWAQKPLKEGQYKYDGKTFIVEKSAYLERTSITVRVVGRFENKPQPSLKKPNALPIRKKDIHFDINKVKEITYNILEPNKKELNVNKERIDLHFTFNPEDGSIENIFYFFNGNTRINLKEIAKIDRQIKKQITANFTGNEYSDYYFIEYGIVSVLF
ncbi:hypothetical protein [Pedobacter insulae]|uniref:DUF3857 domain-containing protein n=1 Tax=Pedobacter insulae TaxID=414048 RepID=A0A1I2ZC30_9SPHI|nr:hypothetical protein [Pedobacter insulae]SFH35165.1 hypothetical protein SAMN04489864_109134 [Pedobacter insulae]